MIMHTLSAHHDIPHGAGLAVLGLAWIRFVAKARPEKFAQFVREILELNFALSNFNSLGKVGIEWFEYFWKSIGCPTRLIDLGIGDELFSQYARETLAVATVKNGKLPGTFAISETDIIKILQLGA